MGGTGGGDPLLRRTRDECIVVYALSPGSGTESCKEPAGDGNYYPCYCLSTQCGHRQRHRQTLCSMCVGPLVVMMPVGTLWAMIELVLTMEPLLTAMLGYMTMLLLSYMPLLTETGWVDLSPLWCVRGLIGRDGASSRMPGLTR